MKKVLLTLSLFTLIPTTPALAQTAAQSDLSTTLSSDQATYQLLEIGSGALAVLSFPESVTSATVTRSGIIETQIEESHVIIGGLANYGETPMLIKTESGQVYTWRVSLSRTYAGRIVNINVLPTPSPAANSLPAPTSQPAPTETSAPTQPTSFTVQRVGPGNNTSLLFQITAGNQAITFDERQFKASAAGKDIRLETSPAPFHQIQPGQTSYGVVTTTQGEGPISITWPYQEGGLPHVYQTLIP